MRCEIFGRGECSKYSWYTTITLSQFTRHNEMRFDSCTTPIQQLYNNPSHEGGPQYVGSTLMWGIIVQLLYWCCKSNIFSIEWALMVVVHISFPNLRFPFQTGFPCDVTGDVAKFNLFIWSLWLSCLSNFSVKPFDSLHVSSQVLPGRFTYLF